MSLGSFKWVSKMFYKKIGYVDAMLNPAPGT